MPNFTHEEFLESLKTISLDSWSIDKKYESKLGVGILHALLRSVSKFKLKEFQDILRYAIKKGHLSPHIFKHNADVLLEHSIDLVFEKYADAFSQLASPIDLALENEELYTFAEFLLKQPIEVDQEYLTLILHSVVLNYEQANKEEKERIIGLFSQRLCGGCDIHRTLNANHGAYNDKYLAHLQWFTGENPDKEKLEGFQPDLFLQIRIRNCIEHYAKEYIGNDGIETEYLKILKSEISRDLQTYWIIRYTKSIQKNVTAAENQERLMKALITGITRSIKKLSENNALIIETGWLGHSVYTRIRRMQNNSYEIMVYNLGELSNKHQKSSRSNYIYPYPLGNLNAEAWDIDKEGYCYLLKVLTTTSKNLSSSKTAPIIYDETSNFSIFSFSAISHTKILIGNNVTNVTDVTSLSFSRVQTAGNCVVANHDAAHRDLIPMEIYSRLLRKESQVPVGRTQQGDFVIPYKEIDLNLWKAELKQILPGIVSATRMYNAYKLLCENKIENDLSWERTKSYFVEPNLRRDSCTYKLNEWLSDLLNEQGQASTHTIHFMLGESGSGKSSNLHWITDYLWDKRKNENQLWIPIFISLSNIPSPREQRNFIESHIFKFFPNVPTLRESLIRKYKFAFILDAYDELQFKDGARDIVQDGFLSEWPGLTIISCRTNVTLDQDFLSGLDNYTISNIEPFNDEGKIEYLNKKNIPIEKMDTLRSTNVWALIDSPLILYMISTMGWQEKIYNDQAISNFKIYKAFIENWFKRECRKLQQENSDLYTNLKNARDNNVATIFQQLSREIGFFMFKHSCLEISKERISDFVKALFPYYLQEFLDKFIQVVLNILPIKKTQDTNFQFIHRSLMEYTAAEYLLELLINQKKAPFLDDKVSFWGKKSVSEELGVLSFLKDVVLENQYSEMLLSIIRYSKNEKEINENLKSQKAIAAGNAFSVLVSAGYAFERQDFKGLYIEKAIMDFGKFMKVQFGGTKFVKTSWSGAILDEANFNEAIFEDNTIIDRPRFYLPIQLGFIENFFSFSNLILMISNDALLFSSMSGGHRCDISESITKKALFSPDKKHIVCPRYNGQIVFYNLYEDLSYGLIFGVHTEKLYPISMNNHRIYWGGEKLKYSSIQSPFEIRDFSIPFFEVSKVVFLKENDFAIVHNNHSISIVKFYENNNPTASVLIKDSSQDYTQYTIQSIEKSGEFFLICLNPTSNRMNIFNASTLLEKTQTGLEDYLIVSYCISPNNNYLLAQSTNYVVVFSIINKNSLLVFNEIFRMEGVTTRICANQFNATEKYLIFGVNNAIQIRECSNGKIIINRILPVNEPVIFSVFSPDETFSILQKNGTSISCYKIPETELLNQYLLSNKNILYELSARKASFVKCSGLQEVQIRLLEERGGAFKSYDELCQLFIENTSDIHNILSKVIDSENFDFIKNYNLFNEKIFDAPIIHYIIHKQNIDGYYNDFIKYLLENMSDVNGVDNFGNTALFYSIQKKHYKTCKLLIDHRVEIFHRNARKQTIFHLAIELSHLESCQFVLDNTVNLSLLTEDFENHPSPLKLAVMLGHKNICSLLVSRLPDNDDWHILIYYFAIFFNQSELFFYFIERNFYELSNLFCTTYLGYPLLLFAVGYGRKDILQFIIERGASSTFIFPDGKPILEFAKEKHGKDSDIVAILSKKSEGANRLSNSSAFFDASAGPQANVSQLDNGLNL